MADPKKRPHLGEISRLVGVVRAHLRIMTPEGMGEFLRCYESVATKLARTSGDMAGAQTEAEKDVDDERGLDELEGED